LRRAKVKSCAANRVMRRARRKELIGDGANDLPRAPAANTLSPYINDIADTLAEKFSEP